MPVAALQYSAVLDLLLTIFNPRPLNGDIGPDELRTAEIWALRVCGLAATNKDISARVNAFGPLAFCGFDAVEYMI